MKDFRFSNEHSRSQVADITGMLRKPRLWIPTDQDYPTHGDWLDKTEAQLADGTKRAMVARMGHEAVGAVIYRQSSDTPEVLELRNISVSPEARGRYVGGFLLRNVEVEASQNDFPDIEQIVVDTKITNEEMINFLLSHGYDIKDVVDLYGLGTGLDVVLSKQMK